MKSLKFMIFGAILFVASESNAISATDILKSALNSAKNSCIDVCKNKPGSNECAACKDVCNQMMSFCAELKRN